MCELMGMSANTPTDVCFSFAGLMERGGKTGPHKDGFGIAFYEGKGVRTFLDHQPCCDSEIARMVASYSIKSEIVISHIRQATHGRVCLANTHPFVRELNGENWVFAHNGKFKGIKNRKLKRFSPVGTTDSEHAFCWMMDQLAKRTNNEILTPSQRARWLLRACLDLSQHGTCNLLMSDGKSLYAFCTTDLVWTTRKAPFARARLLDREMEINFSDYTKPSDVVTVVSTRPLTCDEAWYSIPKHQLVVFKEGFGKVYGDEESRPKNLESVALPVCCKGRL